MNIVLKTASEIKQGDTIVWFDNRIAHLHIVQYVKIDEQVIDKTRFKALTGLDSSIDSIKWYNIDGITRRIQAHEMIITAE